eukprot:SAG31_NODE_11640_length_1011_cov_0.847588_1_plen_249_part_00
MAVPPPPPRPVDCSGGANTAAAAILKNARSICGALQIDQALRSIRLRPEAVQQTAQTLRALGFDEAVDLQLLLPSGPEQMELMDELRARGARIADRGKIRPMLTGEIHTGGGGSAIKSSAGAAAAADSTSEAQPLVHSPRQLQEAGATSSGHGISADTLAIVFSVFVGAAGYLVQVRHIRVCVARMCGSHRPRINPGSGLIVRRACRHTQLGGQSAPRRHRRMSSTPMRLDGSESTSRQACRSDADTA